MPSVGVRKTLLQLKSLCFKSARPPLPPLPVVGPAPPARVAPVLLVVSPLPPAPPAPVAVPLAPAPVAPGLDGASVSPPHPTMSRLLATSTSVEDLVNTGECRASHVPGENRASPGLARTRRCAH